MNTATLKETDKEFHARIDAEDEEVLSIPCPLDSCRAQIGEPCKTDAGDVRCRHARRLWAVRKQGEGK